MARIKYVETGEYRPPRKGEWFRDNSMPSFVDQARMDFEHCSFAILSRIVEPDEGCEPSDEEIMWSKWR